jgi:HAMP domain-containing protein
MIQRVKIMAGLLACLLLFSVPAEAYEFPFNLLRFKPHFRQLKAGSLILSVPIEMTDEITLQKILKNNSELLDKAGKMLELATPLPEVHLYLYRSLPQKKKLTGNGSVSHIEDKRVHRLYEGSNTLAGDIMPLLAGLYLKRCDNIFITTGLRFTLEQNLPEFSAQLIEKGFAELGIMRNPLSLINNSKIESFQNLRTGATAGSFIRFLLTAYPATFFHQWYEKPSRNHSRTFKKIYGFSLSDAKKQWFEQLLKDPIDDDELSELENALNRLRIRTRQYR